MIARFRNLPLTIKVPLIVALLMVSVSGLVSMQVLSRLAQTQIHNLEDLTNAYLDGLSSSLVPHVERDDNWEVFDTLERSRTLYQGLKVRTTIVVRPDSTILASTDPARFVTESALPDSVTKAGTPFGALSAPLIDNRTESWLKRELSFQGRPLGMIFAEIDTSHLIDARRDVLMTLVLTNLLLTAMFVALGWWLVRRMMRPMQSLALRLQSGASGTLPVFSTQEIGDPKSEFGRLFVRYNAMAQAVGERENLLAQLAEEERLASLGRLSSVIAHEINNPLGGLLNAVDTIKHHGDAPAIRRVSVGILERGLNSIREVVGTTLAVYRPDRNPTPLRPSDIDDLRLLINGAAARRDVSLSWINRLELGSALPNGSCLPSGPIRQIILNLLLNAVQAAPVGGEVSLDIESARQGITIRIRDNGPGMPEQAVMALLDEAAPSVPGAKDGIGLWMVNRLVSELKGRLNINHLAPTGTEICLHIPDGQPHEVRDVA